MNLQKYGLVSKWHKIFALYCIKVFGSHPASLIKCYLILYAVFTDSNLEGANFQNALLGYANFLKTNFSRTEICHSWQRFFETNSKEKFE